MFLSKRSNGVYYLWFWDESGKRSKVSTKTHSKPEAQRFLSEFIQKGKEQKSRQSTILLSQFQAEFLTYSTSNHSPKTTRSYKTAFREFIRIVGDKGIRNVTVRDIEQFLSVKKQEASERTARAYFVTLASAYQTAIRWKYLHTNPFRSVEKPRLPEKLPVYLSKDAFRTLQSVTEDSDLRELFQLAVSTGMRLGEILNLQWTDIDQTRKLIRVGNSEGFTTKSKRGRNIPMSDQLSEIMVLRKGRASSELVFHLNGKKHREEFVSKRFKASVRKAGLDDKLHFHSLRHTFASWLVQDGVSLYEVQKLLGHSNISVTQVYSHLQPEKLHSTVNRINISVN
jgi:site-specific recombinase XerD